MNTARKIFILAILLFAFPTIVFADGVNLPLTPDPIRPDVGCVTYDFSAGAGPFEVRNFGGYNGTEGKWKSTTDIFPDGGGRHGTQIFVNTTGYDVVSVEFTFEFEPGEDLADDDGVNLPIIIQLRVPDADSSDDTVNLDERIAQPGSGTHTHSWEAPEPYVDNTIRATTVLVGARSSSASPDNPSPLGSSAILDVTICVLNPPELTKPLQPVDEDEWGMFEQRNTKVVSAFSNAPGALVFAALDGTVSSVTRGSMSECSDLVNDSSDLYCDIEVPGSVNGTGQLYVYSFEGDGFTEFPDVQMVAYEVVISTVLGDITYYVADADEYIEEGTQIEEGCYLGRTLRLDGLQFDVTGDIGAIPAQQGVTLLALNGGSDELLPLLTKNPVLENACNVDPEDSDCIGDTRLSNPQDWQTQGNVTWNDPGLTMGANSTVFQQFNLDATRQPEMKVSARAYSAGARMRLKLGNTENTYNVSMGGFNEYTIAGAQHEADAGAFFTALVQNVSNANIEIEYICINFTLDEDGEPEPPDEPPACYFNNYTFNEGLASWETFGSAWRGYTGEVHSNSTGTRNIGQNVMLFADGGSALYSLYVDVGLQYNSGFDEILYRNDNDTIITVSYQVPGSGFSTLSTVSYAELFGSPAENINDTRLSTTFTINSDINGLFNIRVLLNNPAFGSEGVVLREACINPGGTDWPGYEDNDEDGEPEPLPFPEECEIAPRPQGNDFGQWISWHWHNLNQFFVCELMVLLNNMYQLSQRMFQMLGWQIRWVHAATIQAVNWLATDALYWLAGYLSNASGATIEVGDEGDSGCRWWDIVCHLSGALGFGGELLQALADLLANIFAPLFEFLWRLLSGAFNLLLDLIQVIIGFIIDVVQLILSILVDILVIFWGLIQAYNDAPAISPPGLPDCETNPQGSQMCLVYFAVENTVFSGTWGALIVPLFTSFLWLMLIIWFGKQLLRLATEGGSLL